jgi:acyl carrier protein
MGYRQTTMDPLVAVAALLREVTGESVAVTPATRLADDLRLESIDVAALGEALHARYGVDLPAYLATLDFDELLDLSVGDIAGLVNT